MSDWGPSTICKVYVKGAEKPVEVRINTELLTRAKLQAKYPKGAHNDMDAVCIKVKKTYARVHNIDLGWLTYDKLTIDEIRNVPAGP